MRASPKTPLSARLWARIDTSGGPDACWPWTGAKNADGYGLLHYQGKVLYAHRLVFAFANGGTIPAGHFILHSCDNQPCCNPGHLSNGSVGENLQQALERERLARERNGKYKSTGRKKRGKMWGGLPNELTVR